MWMMIRVEFKPSQTYVAVKFLREAQTNQNI